MKIFTQELFIPKEKLSLNGLRSIGDYFENEIRLKNPDCKPIKFVITRSDKSGYFAEVDFMEINRDSNYPFLSEKSTIFDYKRRSFEDTKKFTAVMIIPTGIGAELGGHCGDAGATARLVASACDTLITHPNVVNASDINEMTENTLYVEGSTLTRLFMGTIGLQPVRKNKLLMIMEKNKDKYFNDEVINAVSSARVTMGLDCDVATMEGTLSSSATYSGSGRAIGKIEGMSALLKIVEDNKNNYDAMALSTIIKVPRDSHKKYFQADDRMINLWGGIESMITHSVAEVFKIPCAHSPMSMEGELHVELDLGIVDPRKAPETASITYLQCILKGLHRSPRVVSPNKGINLENISCLIIPDGCIGLPILSCLENEIPVIAVKNRNIMKNNLKELPFKNGKFFVAENYLEAVGIMNAIKAGVSVESVLRPISKTSVLGD
jgi:hypothetical protein